MDRGRSLTTVLGTAAGDALLLVATKIGTVKSRIHAARTAVRPVLRVTD